METAKTPPDATQAQRGASKPSASQPSTVRQTNVGPTLHASDAVHAIMAHMIPFFPDKDTSTSVVEALVEGGIKYLEVQFPFTDPSADGPVIEAACTKALQAGFTVDQGFAFVRSLAHLCSSKGVEIFIMTYASIPFARGVEQFVIQAKEAGARGLIIPDLPPDSDEGLFAACKAQGLAAVPVVVPSMQKSRIDLIAELGPNWVYCALRAGITGSQTQLTAEVLEFLRLLRSKGLKLLGGFGIQEPSQVKTLASEVDAVVVGSAFVRRIQAHSDKGTLSSLHEDLRSFVRLLSAK